jgi:hypothetical protein
MSESSRSLLNREYPHQVLFQSVGGKKPLSPHSSQRLREAVQAVTDDPENPLDASLLQCGDDKIGYVADRHKILPGLQISVRSFERWAVLRSTSAVASVWCIKLPEALK